MRRRRVCTEVCTTRASVAAVAHLTRLTMRIPRSRAESDGRYWARTSDPQLVERGGWGIRPARYPSWLSRLLSSGGSGYVPVMPAACGRLGAIRAQEATLCPNERAALQARVRTRQERSLRLHVLSTGEGALAITDSMSSSRSSSARSSSGCGECCHRKKPRRDVSRASRANSWVFRRF